MRVSSNSDNFHGRLDSWEITRSASLRLNWRSCDNAAACRSQIIACEEEPEDSPVGSEAVDSRDYDIDHYARQLRQTSASRLACAFTPADHDAVFADPDQMSLFMPAVATIRSILKRREHAVGPG